MPIQPLSDINQKLRSIDAYISSAQEEGADELGRFLQSRTPYLHYAITATKTPQPLDWFVMRYISQAAEFIDALATLANENGFLPDITPALQFVTDSFLNHSSVLGESTHFPSLIEKAYIAQRILEEINDKIMGKTGAPLLPMDTTTANVIIHDIIGEPLASDLDNSVQKVTDFLLSDEQLSSPALVAYVHKHNKQGWNREQLRWPCLAENLGVTLCFATPNQSLQ